MEYVPNIFYSSFELSVSQLCSRFDAESQVFVVHHLFDTDDARLASYRSRFPKWLTFSLWMAQQSDVFEGGGTIGRGRRASGMPNLQASIGYRPFSHY